MTVSRPTISQILEKAFLKDRDLYETCKRTTQDRILARDFTRIFNDYPTLVCPADLSALRDRYMDILRKINADPNRAFLQNEIVQKIEELISDIAILGVSELLYRDGSFNRILLVMLGLFDYDNLLQGQGALIVKSYLSMVIGDVNLSVESNQYQEARGIVMNCVSRRASGIIEAAMHYRARDISLERSFPKSEMLLNYTKEHPRETAAIAVTAGLLVAAGLFGGARVMEVITKAPSLGYKPF